MVNPEFIRVGLVSYKDKKEFQNGEWILHPLTTDIKKIIDLMDTIVPDGGEDIAEDVKYAFKCALGDGKEKNLYKNQPFSMDWKAP